MRARARIILPVMTILLLVVVPSAIAAATVPTGGAAADVAAGQPAVEAPAEAVDEVEQPWTARFLVPMLLFMGVAALVGSALYYGVRIRGKYRVTQ